MIDPYLEAEYNNRAKVPGHPEVIARWVRDAAAFRASHPAQERDLSYGPTARQVLDLFWPDDGRDGPLAMFIHGGYWQGLDKSFFSHLAAGMLSQGIAVAVPSYDLCPDVTLGEIVAQIRVAARFLHGRHGRLDLATGHSAGGHLAAMLLADKLVPAALPISGLFDLAPLIPTTINVALGLDLATARALSPLNRAKPGGRLHAVVGALEGVEYIWQSRRLAEHWDGFHEVLAGHDHFTIPGELARPGSHLTRLSAVLVDR